MISTTSSQPSRGGGFVVSFGFLANEGCALFHAASIAFVASASRDSTRNTVTSFSGEPSVRTSSFDDGFVSHQPFGASNVAPEGVVVEVSASIWRASALATGDDGEVEEGVAVASRGAGGGRDGLFMLISFWLTLLALRGVVGGGRGDGSGGLAQAVRSPTERTKMEASGIRRLNSSFIVRSHVHRAGPFNVEYLTDEEYLLNGSSKPKGIKE